MTITEIIDPVITVTRGPDAIVRARWASGIVIDAAAARRSVELVGEVSDGGRLPLLVDMSDVKSMTRDARAVYADETSMVSLALVGQSPVVRVIANFALSMNKPGVPTRFFTDRDEAETWLRGFQA